MPVYNVEKYLCRCIDSLITQTFTDFELILVDDGSTDQSGRLCDEYALKDRRIRVFHQTNMGVSNARNVGIREVRGQWLSFVDSDDFVEPDYFDVIIGSLHSHTSVDLLFWGAKHLYDSGDVTSYSPHSVYCNNRETIENEILHLKHNPQEYEFFGYTWNKCFNVNIIKKHRIKFTPNLSLKEDEIFTMDYCRYIDSLMVVSDCIYDYRVSFNGLTYQEKTGTEYLLLSKSIIGNIPYLSCDKLIALEYKHACKALVKASKLLKSSSERKKNIPIFLQIYDVCHRAGINMPFKMKALFVIPCPPYLNVKIALRSFFHKEHRH